MKRVNRMHARIALLTALSFLLSAALYGAEKYSQRVGVTFDKKGPNYAAESLIWKTLINRAGGLSNVTILPGFYEELEAVGLKELNANVFLSTAPSTNAGESNRVIVTISSLNNIPGGGVATNAIGGGLYYDRVRLLASLDSLADGIITLLAAAYPRKEKREVETIVVEKRAISEFESEYPAFALALSPAGFQMERLDFALQYKLTNSTYQGNGDTISRVMLNNWYSLSPEAQFRWRWFGARVGCSLDVPEFRNWRVKADISFGIFGSLVTFGPSFSFRVANIRSSGAIIYRYRLNESNYITIETPEPDIVYYGGGLGLNIQVNISRDYYLLYRQCFPGMIYNLDIDMKNTALSNYTFRNEKLNDNNSLTEIVLNVRVAEHQHLYLYYSYSGAGVWLDFNNNDSSSFPIEIGRVSNQIVYLGSVYVKSANMGIGYQYEF